MNEKPKKKRQPESIGVEGIVAARNKTPYLLLFKGDQQLAQLTMSDARNIAHDILTTCARTEADAIIHKFFDKQEFPSGAATQLMADFRIFRYELDLEKPDVSQTVPASDFFDFTKKKPQ